MSNLFDMGSSRFDPTRTNSEFAWNDRYNQRVGR